jgi:hypothetical protein
MLNQWELTKRAKIVRAKKLMGALSALQATQDQVVSKNSLDRQQDFCKDKDPIGGCDTHKG